MAAVDVKIPALGESISEGVIARWLKPNGSAVRTDEPLVELETDKASVEIPAPQDGILRIVKQVGDTVTVGEVIAHLEEGVATAPTAAAPTAAPAAPLATPSEAAAKNPVLAPTVRKLVAEHGLDPDAIAATGRGGRITPTDVLSHLEHASAPVVSAAAVTAPVVAAPMIAAGQAAASAGGVRRVPMTRLRQRIAERLVQAQHTAAILTTFNEVDMTAVMDWRARHKERFQKVHGVSLGFMSFFAKASIEALKDVPVVGAQLVGTDLVYQDDIHLGIAVATGRGLVVPVVHGAQALDIAGLEKEVARLAALAKDGKLGINDLAGGTFSITNGGVFGSLLSTPILNPPQSGILGMHKIEKRAVVVNDQIVIRPMMYVALSYDHRLIDGSDAVTFLVKVKERLEDPSRLLLGV